MKKVIRGSLYNTETAKKLGYTYAKGPKSDLSYWEEVLFRTNSGKYFIYGSGAAMSRYSEVVDQNGSRGWGEKIIPISEEAAMNWIENNLSAEEYEAIFGEITEDTARVSVSLPISLVEKMDAKREELHISRADIIAAGLRQYLKE